MPMADSPHQDRFVLSHAPVSSIYSATAGSLAMAVSTLLQPTDGHTHWYYYYGYGICDVV
jgi:hypothetical protein